MSRSLILIASLVLSAAATAQDALDTDADKYKVMLENDSVRVLAYHDRPGERTRQHRHPAFVLYAIAPFKRTIALPDGQVRQLAKLDVRTEEAGVALRAVDGDALFADLPDEWNALRVTTGDGRVFTARGRGAGRTPTAESVWADLLDIVEP